ncbi:MAG: sulfurtransferase TusA family protein [Bacillota bacterium]|nr:sulfurtransferase TusA family protein [Bacillota bacterium]
MAEGIPATKEIDARGSFCPGPMMELIRAMRSANVGDVIAVLSTDQGSKRDIPNWAQKAGQEFLGVEEKDGYDRILVKKVK